MEYCSLGDLSTYMKEHSNGKGMSEPDLIHFLSQIGNE
jgi:serine/threonine protein kinase